MSNTLDGRVVIVTGAGGGIGREHALLFARHGARVVVNDLGSATNGTGSDTGAAQAVVDEIVALGGEAVADAGSVADWSGAERLVQTAIDTFGDLHAVVNNAGILRDRMLVNMTESDFDAVIAVHLKGTFNVTRFAATYWREQAKAGSVTDRAIVNTASSSGLHGNRGQTNYAAAKAGIAAMTIVNSMELERYGVRANCIAPFARTRMVLQTPGIGEAVKDVSDEDRFDLFSPANISPLVVYLASPDCPFTGQAFSVYGGHVGLYQGWSIAESVESEEPWTLEELSAAMDKLPRSVPATKQMDKVRPVLGM
jgi:NAD(P)-dependent dehydrogenase (short-subunit alcohol dehydrogenase family)